MPTKNGMRRLAMRAGVKRIGDAVLVDAQLVLRAYLNNVIRDTLAFTQVRRRKTVTAPDVQAALQRGNRQLYGFK